MGGRGSDSATHRWQSCYLVKAAWSLPLIHKRRRSTGAQGSMNWASQGRLGISSFKSRPAYLCAGRAPGNSVWWECISVCAHASVRVCPRTGTYPKKLVQWCRIHLTRITKDQWSKMNHISLRVFKFLRGPIKTNKHTNKQKPLFTV